MTLSYTLRLLCLLAVVTGTVTALVQILLACNARFVSRHLETAAARSRERVLYVLQIAPLFVAVLVGGALFLPEYLLYEPTRGAEPVSWLSLVLAAAVGLWFGTAALRGLRIALRTLRFIAACRRCGRSVPQAGRLTPILALTEPILPVALIGFLRPFILISADLLEAGGLNSGCLQVALDHERSHALHHDNWKLLSLSFLPRLPADPWQRHWQRVADWAADDDAVSGDPARSLLLAEALVRTARLVQGSRVRLICTALTSTEAGLAARIDRLLRPRQASRPTGTSLSLALGGLLLVAVAAAVIATPWVYSLSESFLHLGGF